MKVAIADTGVLVNFLNRAGNHHAWARAELTKYGEILTSESVLAETLHLLRNIPGGYRPLLEMMLTGLLKVPFHLDEEYPLIAEMMIKYADLPMSLADAGLVRLGERYPRSPILTLDTHFRIYRNRQGYKLNTRMPESIP